MTDACPYMPYPPGTSLRGLRTAELFVVLSVRLWVQAAVAPERAAGDWREGCRHAGIDEDGIAEFDRLFGIVATAVNRGLDVHPFDCPKLGADETLLLAAVAEMQHRREAGFGCVLTNWLPPAARRLAYGPLLGVAAALARVRLIVPLRPHDTDSPIEEHRIPSPDPGYRLIH